MIPGKCPDYETGYGSGIAIKSLNYGNSPVFLDGANKKPTRKIKGNFSMMNSKLYSILKRVDGISDKCSDYETGCG